MSSRHWAWKYTRLATYRVATTFATQSTPAPYWAVNCSAGLWMRCGPTPYYFEKAMNAIETDDVDRIPLEAIDVTRPELF